MYKDEQPSSEQENSEQENSEQSETQRDFEELARAREQYLIEKLSEIRDFLEKNGMI